MGGIEGVILHSSVLINANDRSTLSPSLDFIFPALQFSQLPKAFHFGDDLSAEEVSLLETKAKEYSFHCFHSSESTVELSMNGIALAWGDLGLRTLYVVSGRKKDSCLELSDHGFLLSVLDGNFVEDPNNHPSIEHIKKLEELPLSISCYNKKVGGNESIIVGYNMKPSRQRDFAKRGAFPLYTCNTSQQKLIFVPITYELPMSMQLQQMDVVLHKATDYIVSIDLNTSMPTPNIAFTDGMDELRRTLEGYPQCCVIDPLINLYPVIDRLRIQEVLLGLEDVSKEGRSIIRGAHFLKVDNFNDLNLPERLVEAKLSFPSIVKPQVACGVSNAHSMVYITSTLGCTQVTASIRTPVHMTLFGETETPVPAIVFRLDDYKDLPVPLPAIIQEYVNHSSTLFKLYVIGEKVFHAVKKSTPNADTLMKSFEGDQLKPLVFDSLKSLPTTENNQSKEETIDLELVKDAASWLRKKLDLTIFGFDVVVQDNTFDHVIVDVNYLPSFKEVPDNVAIPAFWEAIYNKFRERQADQSCD